MCRRTQRCDDDTGFFISSVLPPFDMIYDMRDSAEDVFQERVRAKFSFAAADKHHWYADAPIAGQRKPSLPSE